MNLARYLHILRTNKNGNGQSVALLHSSMPWRLLPHASCCVENRHFNQRTYWKHKMQSHLDYQKKDTFVVELRIKKRDLAA